MEHGTYVEVEGTFRFAINKSGLDYNDPKQRQAAIDDFKAELEDFVEETNNKSFAAVSYNEKDIKVSKGE